MTAASGGWFSCSCSEHTVGLMIDAESKPLAPTLNKNVVGTAQGGISIGPAGER